MKRSVTVNVNEEKLSAIEMYLEQKSTLLQQSLTSTLNSSTAR